MPRVTIADVAGTLEQLQARIAELFQRIQALENGNGHAGHARRESEVAAPLVESRGSVDPGAGPEQNGRAAVQGSKETPEAGITEDELMAISAAIGAFLGVKAHIRQIRLVSTSAWAQQGRVSIQASHRLQG